MIRNAVPTSASAAVSAPLRRNAQIVAAATADVTAALRAAPAAADEAGARRAPPADTNHARFAAFVPSTYDATARTVEVVLSSGAPVRRWSFTEELEISATAIDLGRVLVGQCPLLDTHQQNRLEAVLGRVASTRIEGTNLIGLLAFGDTEQARIAEGMVARGEVRGVSIGYRVKAWAIITIDDNDHETWRATSWELLEASLVPVPADANAGVRSAVSHPGAIGAPATPQEDEDMRRSHSLGGPAAYGASRATYQPTTDGGGAAPASATPAADDAARTAPAVAAATLAAADDATRAIPTGSPAPVVQPAATVATVARFSATDGLGFIDQARSLGVETRARELLAQNERGEIGVETARSAILTAAAEHQRAATGTVVNGGGARAGDGNALATRNAIIEALACRATGAQPSEQARQFMDVRLLELASERANLPRSERDPTTILRAAHTTSDFPIILEGAGNRIVRERYAAQAPTYRAIARRRDLRDFRPTKLLDIGSFPTLKKYLEDGEIKSGTINEGKESVQLASYGRILRLTRQMIVNDDLNAFDDVFGSIGTMLANFENATFWAMKLQNGGLGPKMADGKTFFHADHGNLAASGAAPDITTLGTARASIRKQKDIDGNVLNLTPKVLLIGADLETVADQLTASIQAVQLGQVNPFANKLTPVAEGAITGNSWEVYADPAQAPAFSYGYLSDAPGPRVMTQEGFDTDGVAFRVTLDFYTGPTDYRPAFRNAGAA